MDIILDNQTNNYFDFTRDVPRPRSMIMDNDMFFFVMSITMGVICQTVTVFGVISNVINIVVFIKQGFSDCINISLISLAVSDLLAVLFLLWMNICFTSGFRFSVPPLVIEEIHTITGGWPCLTFTRTTGWITMFISIERCMCVIRPLQVKAIFTHRRHVISMVTIFSATVGSSCPAYVILGIDWKFYPDRNATLIGIIERFDFTTTRIIDCFNYAVVGVFMPVTCFCSILICTVFLVVKLNQQRAWRSSSLMIVNETQVISSKNTSISRRDQKVAKMVVFISATFIICLLPNVIFFVAGFIEPELSYDGFYRNIFISTNYSCGIACTINSSMNIFVYIGMSTKYRYTLYATVNIALRYPMRRLK